MAHEGRHHHRFTRIAGSAAAVGLLLAATFVTGVQARNAHHAAAASPTYGGSITIRTTNPADCLDPDKTASATADGFDSLILDPLLSIDPKGHYTGDLATKYKVVNKAGTKIDFFLRQGVKFSNGDPFTATDVKYSFDRAVDPATKSPVTASQLAALQSTKIINKYEVQLTLKNPFRPLLTNLASAYTGILDHKVGGNCTGQIGTGIYKVVSTGTAFDDVVFTANKNHNFGPSWVQNKGVPWITKLEFKNITSDATAISSLLSGGLDISNIPGTQLSRVQGNKSFIIHKLPAQNCTFVEFNTSHPPFNNVAVRRAFAEIIDRKNIVKAALNGLGAAVYGPIPPAIPFYDKNVTKVMPKFNIAAATKTISAQHATGPYDFLSFNSPEVQTASEIIQADAGQAGMKLNIDTKGSVGDFIAAANKGSFDVLIIGYGYNDPDVMYLLLHSSQGGGKGLNWTNDTNNPQLDNLLTLGRTTLQKKKVISIMNKTQELIDKQAEMLGVYATVPLDAVRTKIKGFHTDVSGNVAYQDLYVKTK
jgi:peptide/nickel transport system substrate-binding protein